MVSLSSAPGATRASTPASTAFLTTTSTPASASAPTSAPTLVPAPASASASAPAPAPAFIPALTSASAPSLTSNWTTAATIITFSSMRCTIPGSTMTPRRSFLNARPRMTYGRSRSSINDKGGDVELLKATTNTSVKRSLQESFSVSSTLEEQQKSLRASHELQEAGQGHRFQDELEYLLEGIQERERLQVRRQRLVNLAQLAPLHGPLT
ncbi:hypothetical protein BGW41_000633 [Actinomortierella wolfii]|nr:hypothetical protein BGW41_000633 [Actinomortierella wolfii]